MGIAGEHRFSKSCLLAAAVRVMLAAAIVPPAPGRVLVVTEGNVPAFAEAVEGVVAPLGAAARVIDIHGPRAASELTDALQNRETQVVIAIGSRAFGELVSRKPSQPVISAMMLRGSAAEAAAQIPLDLPLTAQLAAIRAVMPQISKVGIIRNPARSRVSAESLENQARREGYQAKVEDCDSPARLLTTVAAFRNRVDVLLCFPDPDLYNSATIQPLVMASIEYRLPVFGFSPAFVRAGAAAGVYPDYRALGRQTAELALRVQRGEGKGEAAEEYPGKVRIAVNLRMVHLLGLNLQMDRAMEVFR